MTHAFDKIFTSLSGTNRKCAHCLTTDATRTLGNSHDKSFRVPVCPSEVCANRLIEKRADYRGRRA